MKITPKTQTQNFKAFHKNSFTHVDECKYNLQHYTYFFRHPESNEQIINYLANKFPNEKLTILSTGCSYGEEVYTFAMLAENAGLKADVIGIDLDEAVAKEAESGEYELNTTEYDYLIGGNATTQEQINHRKMFFDNFAPTTEKNSPDFRNYFYKIPTQSIFYKKKDKKLANCTFKKGNLLELNQQFPKNSMNLVLCRNVFYHLIDRNIRQSKTNCHLVEAQLSSLLKKDGLLVFAPNEVHYSQNMMLKFLEKDPTLKCLDNKTKAIWVKIKE